MGGKSGPIWQPWPRGVHSRGSGWGWGWGGFNTVPWLHSALQMLCHHPSPQPVLPDWVENLVQSGNPDHRASIHEGLGEGEPDFPPQSGNPDRSSAPGRCISERGRREGGNVWRKHTVGSEQSLVRWRDAGLFWGRMLEGWNDEKMNTKGN